MRIALICTEKLPVPPVAGGAVQIYIDGILPYLEKKFDVTVFSVTHQGLAAEERYGNIRFIRLDAKPKEEYIKNVVMDINDEYDLIHVFNRPKWIRPLSQKLPHTRMSLSLHNEMFKPGKITGEEAACCIDRVEFINTVSRFIADGVVKYYPQAKKKIRVIYSGVDIDTYKPNWSSEGTENRKLLMKKYGLQDNHTVLFVGRLSEKKGVDILLKAMDRVMKHYKRTALVIVGSKWFGKNEKSEYTNYLRKLSSGLEGRIVFTGFLTPGEVVKHYNLADVFVCPSQWEEPLARVHYEAMAAGVPIITTNRGGNAEVVSGLGNGIVIDDYNNPKILADAIEFVLKNPERALRTGIEGRLLAERYFSWERVAEDIIREFEGV